MQPTQSDAKPRRSAVLTPEELAPLFPQYEILRILGRGGMGAVYLARQLSLNRLVAIKILPADLDDGSALNFPERFKNEAQAMAQLSHPGIVAVFDFGQTEVGRFVPEAPSGERRAGDSPPHQGLLFIVMEYIEGTDVQQMVAQQGRLHSAHAMAITAHVCDALAYAHSRGIIHRDIKPSNIMVSSDGVVKVADFGLAKMSQDGKTGITQSGVAMGTLHFMAPEALTLGVAVDQRADIYAVGVMLYQMLTGKLPQGLFEMPSLQVPGLDPRYDGIVTKALREDRNVRYQQASDLRHDLDAILTQPVVKVEPPEEKKTPAALPPAPQARSQAQPQRSAGQPYRPPQRSAPPPPKKKSSTGLILAGLGVLALVAAAVFLMEGKGDTSKFAGVTKDNPFVNTLGMKFVPVPDTKVLFCIHETRRQDYAAFAESSAGLNSSWKNAERRGFPCGHEDDHPAVNICWDDAKAYCEWLSKKEGLSYRLATDAEWSYATGIGIRENSLPSHRPEDLTWKVDDVFPWPGSYPPSGAKIGNYADKAWKGAFPTEPSIQGYDDGFATTAPVMSFPANNLGILGMHFTPLTTTYSGEGAIVVASSRA